jgi:ribosome-binding protein aMBF1 (putative translation factor)
MPSFKPKTNKKIIVEQNKTVTLDSKHNEIMDNINEIEEETIPKLRERVETLKNEYKKLRKGQVDERLDIKDKLKEIKSSIRVLGSKKNNYFLDNSKNIFAYFENKKNISTNVNSEKSTKLNSFFKLNDDNEHLEKTNNIVNEYLCRVDESFIETASFVYSCEMCSYCGKGELIPVDEDGVLVCNSCSKYVHFLIENEKPSYKEPPKEVCFYAYKRINHFREILAQFQAKETTQIPDNVIEDIKHQIKKERIDKHQINNVKAKEMLKKLGYNKYYEHIPFIKDIIGIKPPVMNPELEDTLCNLFMDIQRPYAKFCPDDRVNFLNYYYTVYKLCELLDQTQFLPFFPMLKDREKRIEQDNIWKQICNELEWAFIPTI